jgi:hypothetical protein
MSEDLPSATAPIADAEYDAIWTALMATPRGRRFLDAYTSRHRGADTDLLLAAIGRLEAAVRGEPAPPREDVSRDLADMARALARATAALAAIKPDPGRDRKADGFAADAGAMSQTAAMALSAALAAAERIRDIAWTMREPARADAACDSLEAAAREIETACKLHAVTGRREQIAVRALAELRARVDRLLGRSGSGKSQPGAAAPRETAAPEVGSDSAVPASSAQVHVELEQLPTDQAGMGAPGPPAPTAASQPVRPPQPASRALAAIAALSDEEKIALTS